jgi:hypothetical protein
MVQEVVRTGMKTDKVFFFEKETKKLLSVWTRAMGSRPVMTA